MERDFSRSGGDQVLRVEIRIADDADGAVDLGDGLPGHLEQTGAVIAGNAVIGHRAIRALDQKRLVESLLAAGVAAEHG